MCPPTITYTDYIGYSLVSVYYNSLTLPTEERRVISRRALKVAELNEEWVTKEVYIGDVLIDKTIMKAKLPREPPFAK